MRCAAARKAIVDRRLGPLSPAVEGALREHLAVCSACDAENRLEETLVRDLALLRESAPFEVEVTARVMREIRGLGRVDRREVPARQLAWATASAYALGLLMLAAGIGLWTLVPESSGELRSLAGALGGTLAALSRPAVALLGMLKGLGRAALEFVEVASHLLLKLQPIFQATMLIALVGMATFTTFVLGRDLLPSGLRKEP